MRRGEAKRRAARQAWRRVTGTEAARGREIAMVTGKSVSFPLDPGPAPPPRSPARRRGVERACHAMRPRAAHVLCLSALLVGLALSIYKVHFPPGPIADEAAYVMMTQSLWHDHDLRYDARDLLRA